MYKRVECIISGRVQMVMFRDFVTRKSRKLKLTGYVENLPNGTVHVVAEGGEKTLENLIEYLYKGSVLSYVEDVSVVWQEATGIFETFKIKYK